MFRWQITYLAVVVTLLLPSVGCTQSWHDKCGWKAEDYFDDPQVIDLCQAIEANDLKEMDRLVAAGADVNAKGKGNMTPLLWAYPENKLERFELLLKHGADPNVIIESDFNTRGGMRAGDSVTHMVCKTEFPGYFEAVFEHGGDPNLVKNGMISNQTPLHTLISGRAHNKESKVMLLIEKNANINHMDGSGTTPAMRAIGWGEQFGIALIVLKAGADHEIYKPKSNSKLVHMILAKERLMDTWSSQQKSDYQNILKWLEDNGESIERAKADRQRWESWSQTNGEYQRKMQLEIAARKAKEAKAKQGENQ